jgi:hypothetical protein
LPAYGGIISAGQAIHQTFVIPETAALDRLKAQSLVTAVGTSVSYCDFAKNITWSRELESRLARIIHEGFYYNRRDAVPTGVLATQSVNILFKYASLLPGCACPSHDASQRFRHESS